MDRRQVLDACSRRRYQWMQPARQHGRAVPSNTAMKIRGAAVVRKWPLARKDQKDVASRHHRQPTQVWMRLQGVCLSPTLPKRFLPSLRSHSDRHSLRCVQYFDRNHGWEISSKARESTAFGLNPYPPNNRNRTQGAEERARRFKPAGLGLRGRSLSRAATVAVSPPPSKLICGTLTVNGVSAHPGPSFPPPHCSGPQQITAIQTPSPTMFCH